MKALGARLKAAEFVRTVHHYTPEAGTPIEEMKKPEYWVHVAKRLKVGDRIEVDSEERTWFAEFAVRHVDGISATVALMRHVEFNRQTKDAEETEFSAKHSGRGIWHVQRNSDKAKVKEGFATKEAAEAWIVKPQ